MRVGDRDWLSKAKDFNNVFIDFAMGLMVSAFALFLFALFVAIAIALSGFAGGNVCD